jgi:RNase P subunit RPR2
MADPDLVARLTFLDKAATLLLASVPETSRTLMSDHSTISFDNDANASNGQTQGACGACGTLIVLGHQGTLRFDKLQSKKQKSKNTQQTSKQPNQIIYTCNTCGRFTQLTTSTRTKPPRQRHVTPKDVVIHAAQPTQPQTANSNQPNAGVKKRSKSGKKGGLAAMLAKQKDSQASSSGFGLNLMDFMKNS